MLDGSFLFLACLKNNPILVRMSKNLCLDLYLLRKKFGTASFDFALTVWNTRSVEFIWFLHPVNQNDRFIQMK